MRERLTVVTDTAGQCRILALAGELDFTNAAQVGEAVEAAWDASVPYLVFDLSRLTFMDSAGVRIFVRVRRQAAEHRRTVALAGLTPSVSRIIELTGLNQAFAIHATVDEALPS
jgi:anti-sigma B factor antagonist